MNLIAAVDQYWAIGNKNKLLASIPADMKYFMELTMGNVVVLGRKTLEGFPSGLPLQGRTNIVLTNNEQFKVRNAFVIHSIEQLNTELQKFPSKEVYVVGGASIYQQLLPYCNTAYITKIDHAYPADAYCPNLDIDEEWVCIGESEEQTYFDLEYVFSKYERKIRGKS